MAELIKAKPTTYTNKPIGVVQARTGEPEMWQEVQRASNRASDMFFAELVSNEKRKGKKFGYDSKVQVRDKDGKFILQPINANLSQIAKETAEPIRRARISDALIVDLNKELVKIRAKSNNAQHFKDVADAFILEEMKNINKSGGENYSNIYKDLSVKEIAQHYNHMLLKESEEAKRIDTNNAVFRINKGIEELNAHLTNGADFIEDGLDEISVELIRDGLIYQAKDLLDNGDIQEPKYRDMVNNIHKGFNDGKINYVMQPILKDLSLPASDAFISSIRTGKILDTDKKLLDVYDIDQEFIDGITNIRTNRDYHAGRVGNIRNNISNRVNLIKSSNKALAFKNKITNNQIFNMTKKDQKSYDIHLANEFNDGNAITANWVLANWNKENFLNEALKGNKLPESMDAIFNNAEFFSNLQFAQPNQARAMLTSALKLFDNIVYSQDVGGNKMHKHNIDAKSFSNWVRLKKLATVYGDEALPQLIARLYTADTSALEINQKANISNIDSDYKTAHSPKQWISNKLFEMGIENGWNSEAIQFLMPVAMHQMSIANTSLSDFEEVLENTYDNMYISSPFIYNIGYTLSSKVKKHTFAYRKKAGGTGQITHQSMGSGKSAIGVASRFAPERYFGDNKDLLAEFIKRANKDLDTKHGGNYEIGVNAFLLPSHRSTSTQAEYMIVDQNGHFIENKETNNILQIQTSIMDKQVLAWQKREQEERWEKANRKRKSIELSKKDAAKKLSGNWLDIFKSMLPSTGP